MATTCNVKDECPAKKLKLNDSNSETVLDKSFSIHTELSNLSQFQIDKVLYNNSNRKTICLQGTFSNVPGTGIVLLEKSAFEEEKLKQDKSEFFHSDNLLEKQFHNDIYGNYEYLPKIETNKIKTTIIHPATDKHIEKYSVQNIYIIDETPDIYKNIVLPYLESEQLNLQWVYNILEHKSEKERIVYEDSDEENGFVLLPDLKWDGKTLETLYLLAITRKHDIKSLRDLKGKHLPLLKNILDKGSEAIKDKYGLDKSRLRIYLHYQPSFYHLHVHFTYLQYDAPGIFTERAHLLNSVINNLELLPDYYQESTIPFTVRKNTNLYKTLQQKGLLE